MKTDRTTVSPGGAEYVRAIKEIKSLAKLSIYTENGASILDLPDYVFTEFRNGYWITVNYTSNMVTIPISANAKVIIGSENILPGEVLVWE